MTKDIATVKAALECTVEHLEGEHDGKVVVNADVFNALYDFAETALSSPPAAPTPDNNGWRDISTAPDNTTGYAFVWIEYKDRSGPGFFARAFCYKGDWQIDNFKQWDYEHKEPTHWRPIFAPPPPALDKGE